MTSGGAARIRVVAGRRPAASWPWPPRRRTVHFGSRVSTDDAQVDAHIAPIGAKVGGNISEILVADNQVVKAGQVLLRIDPRDYQARLDQACAQLAAAESQAARRGCRRAADERDDGERDGRRRARSWRRRPPITRGRPPTTTVPRLRSSPSRRRTSRPSARPPIAHGPISSAWRRSRRRTRSRSSSSTPTGRRSASRSAS